MTAATAATAAAITEPASASSNDTTQMPQTEAAAITPLCLWYDNPARAFLEALPIGNGRLGAMVFGGVTQEKLLLNESNIWAGSPHDYANPNGPSALPEIRRLVFAEKWAEAQALVDAQFMGTPVRQAPYQLAGDLLLTFDGSEAEPGTYRRWLDLENAVVCSEYTAGGVKHTRETWASFPDQVIVMRLTCDTGALSFDAAFSGPMPDTKAEVRGRDTLFYTGRGTDTEGIPGTVRFCAGVRVIAEGGAVSAGGNRDSLHVSGANAVTLLISVGSSYKDYTDVSGDPEAVSLAHLEAAAKKTPEALRRAHVADYQRLWGTVFLDLSGPTDAYQTPTDVRVKSFGDGKTDTGLAALHFQYGRYLLIASSRAGSGGQAANLQGLWNDSLTPPWGSKFTININTEMNYFPAGPANLLETYPPLFELIEGLAETGHKTAEINWGAKRGWVAHHNTDAWRGAAPVDGALYGQWALGGAWLCKSLWDYWEFTGDKTALARHYPLLKGAAEFFLETLIEEPKHNYLVMCPDMSPERSHHKNVSLCAGATMSNQIVRDLFEACLQAGEILETSDADFRAEVKAAHARLAPMQVSETGQLQEWLADWEAEAPDKQHRHISQLYGLHPSAQITRRKTPDLWEAARKTLEARGDAATGWSLAWKINFWARMENGNRAYKLMADLIKPEHTAPNLFDLHPPFQIDGNFGAVSGVCEMLLQSHAGELHFLPALPSAWLQGRVSGLRARGGATVGLTWKNGGLETAEVTPAKSGPLAFRLGEAVTTKKGVAHQTLHLTAADFTS